MTKPTLWRLAIILTLLAAIGYFALPGTPTSVKSPPPVGKPPSAPAHVPAGVENLPAPAAEPRTGRMEMSSSPPSFAPTPSAPATLSYSLKKENSERTILPGVTYSPGQGVNIKTANTNETVQIKRDAGQTTDYQVMWQKKY